MSDTGHSAVQATGAASLKSEHTPGPWRDNGDPTGGAHPNYHEICAGAGYLGESTQLGFAATGYMSEADARLIAAAPDLLAALREFVAAEERFRREAFTPTTMVDALADAYEHARAAIIRATGEQP